MFFSKQLLFFVPWISSLAFLSCTSATFVKDLWDPERCLARSPPTGALKPTLGYVSQCTATQETLKYGTCFSKFARFVCVRYVVILKNRHLQHLLSKAIAAKPRRFRQWQPAPCVRSCCPWPSSRQLPHQPSRAWAVRHHAHESHVLRIILFLWMPLNPLCRLMCILVFILKANCLSF